MRVNNVSILDDTRLTEYALGTLEPAEAAEVEALLAHSAEARAELRSLRSALVGLTESLPPITPPAHVWERVQAQLGDAENVKSEPTPAVTLPGQPVPVPPQQPWQGYLGWAFAACLSLLVLGEGIWLSSSQRAYRQAEHETRLVTTFLSAPEVTRMPLYGREREGIGSVLKGSDNRALFVLAQAPATDKVYQAWGHTSDNWTPGSSERLTSLGVSDEPIFEIATQEFAALYLSLEPVGGSPQPTFALSRISLTEPVATAPLSVTTPVDGATLDSASVIVAGEVDGTITNLSYVLNGEEKATTFSGTRFSFTATLQRGANTLTVRAYGPQGVTEETLELTRR